MKGRGKIGGMNAHLAGTPGNKFLIFSTIIIILVVLTGPLIFVNVPALSAQAPGSGQSATVASLDTLLQMTADYCRELENAVFDFVCLEEIKERIDPTLDLELRLYADSGRLERWRSNSLFWAPIKKIKNSYVYDYQCIRSGGEIREIRMLLKKNGKKMNEPNAKLETSIVVYKNVLFSPANLFSERFQPTYDFRIVGKGKIEGRPVVIVDATPRAGAAETKNLYGRAWIDEETADILKIEWSENRIGHYDIFQLRGKKYRRQPRITSRSEFLAEKNGIRFPSRLFVEEAYINEKGNVSIRSETTVVYRDFRFFTVEVEIR